MGGDRDGGSERLICLAAFGDTDAREGRDCRAVPRSVAGGDAANSVAIVEAEQRSIAAKDMVKIEEE